MSSYPSTGLVRGTDGQPASEGCQLVPRREGRLDEEALTALLRAIVVGRRVCPPEPAAVVPGEDERHRVLRLAAAPPPDRHVLIAPSDATPWQEIAAVATAAEAAGLPDVRFVAQAAATSRAASRPAPPSAAIDASELDAEIAALGDARSAWEQEAVRRLEARGAAVVPRLLRELDADHLGGVGRARILTLLGRIGAPEGLPAVLAAATGDRLSVSRAAAIDAASAFPDPRATAVLIRLLEDPDRDVVTHAVLMLGDRRDPAAVPRLGALLESPAQGIRYTAARALSRTATREARALLRSRLDRETDAEVRAAITSGL